MPEVPPVNPEPAAEIPDSAGSNKQWIDPIFEEMNPERLADEPEPTPEEIAAQEAEEAAAQETERKANGEPTKAELAALLAEIPDDEPEEGAEAKKDDDAAAKASDGEQPDKDAEEAKKKADDDTADGEEEDDAEKAKQDDEQAGKKPRRRSRARRDRRAMERKLLATETELAALKNQAPQAPSEPAEEATPQPTLEEFGFDTDKWAEAVSEWAQGQVDAGKEQAAKAEQAKAHDAARQKFREIVAAHGEREEDARDEYEDYEEVTRAKDLKITDEMFAVIMESEIGPRVAYHLGKNPGEAARIAGLSPLAQAKALGRIETRLEAEQAKAEPAETTETNEAEEAEDAEKAKPNSQPAAAKAPRRTPTQAPEPVPTLSGVAAGSRDASRMGMDEYAEGRRTGKIR